MNDIKLPEFIIYTDGTRILSSKFEKEELVSGLIELRYKNLIVTIVRMENGSLLISGNIYFVTKPKDFDDSDIPSISDETLKELNLINGIKDS